MRPKDREYHMADRRRRVAALMLRGLTQREIAQALPQGEKPIFNPDTGKPYDVATINRDIQRIEEEWKEQSLAALERHKARHFAEVSEVKRSAWQRLDLNNVLKALKAEADLFGLYEPQKQQHMGPGGGPIQMQNVEDTQTSDEIRRIEEHIAQLEEEIEIDGR